MTDLAYATAIAFGFALAWDGWRRRLSFERAKLHSDTAMDELRKHVDDKHAIYQRAQGEMIKEMRAAIGERKEGEPDLSSRVRNIETTRAAGSLGGNQAWRRP